MPKASAIIHIPPLQEERVEFDLPVSGRLPSGLQGIYVRNGANPLPADAHRPRRRDHHWPEGPGMVHGICLAGEQVRWYRNRWITTPEVAQAGNMVPLSMPSALVPEGSGNGGLIQHGGQLYACSEMALPYLLSNTLESRTISNFNDTLLSGSIAHPHLDASSGMLHTLAFHPEPPWLQHHVIDATLQRASSRNLPVDRPVLVHDFALTPNYLVLFNLPVLFSEQAMHDGQPVPWRWDDTAPAFIGLIPRHDDAGHTTWAEIAPCWISHLASAHEHKGEVVIHAIQRPSLLAGSWHEEADDTPVLIRCSLRPGQTGARMDIIDSDIQEYPVTDTRAHMQQQNPGFWTLGMQPHGQGCAPVGDRIYRHDPARDRRSCHVLPDGWLASELTFVPRHKRAPAMDGWLIGFMQARREACSVFAVFDTRDLAAGAVAQVRLPQAVPGGTHGCWLPG